jgi:glycoside/pentoside/hexuronide:cation symporter, GPH family
MARAQVRDDGRTSGSARPLSRGQRLVYGFGDLALAVRQTAFQFALLPFFTDVVMLAPWLAGLGKMLGLVWDGVNDPVTGYVSDRTRTRYGRRRPFLVAAAIPMGLTFALLWMPPSHMSGLAAFAYMVLAYLVLDTCFTLYATPYMALGAELSDDYHERTQLSAARSFFHVIGLFLGGTVPFAMLRLFPEDKAHGYAAMGVTIGAFMTIVALVTGLGVRERIPRLVDTPTDGASSFRAFVGGLATTMRNRAFRIMVVTFGVIQIGGGIHQTLVPYAFQYWLRRQDLIGTVIAVYMASFLLSIPLWTHLSKRLGKDRALKLCMSWAAFALTSLPFVLSPDMSNARLGVILVLAGLGNGGWAVLPVSITADIIDTDELETHRRREGEYFGLWTLALKLATGLASGIVGVGLQLVEYVPNVEQTPSAILGIRILYGPVPAAFLLAGLVLFYRFPLTRERHALVQAALAARRA